MKLTTGSFTKNIFLSLIIPTFSRFEELARCIGSVAAELDSLTEEDRFGVEIIVGDNCSPRPPSSLVFSKIVSADIVFVQRSKNEGGLANILDLNTRARGEYVMWLTDDDALLPGALNYILSNLKALEGAPVGFIWGCLPTFDARTGKVAYIDSQSFPKTTRVEATRINASAFAPMAWSLSRQIYHRSVLNLECIWGLNNAYAQIALAAHAISAKGGLFLEKPYVLHSYFNHEHWEEWGEDVLIRKLRVYCDGLWILEHAIQPQPHESEVLRHLQAHRVKKHRAYLGSVPFRQFLERDGAEFVLQSAKVFLQDYEHIYSEVAGIVSSLR